MEVLGKRMRYWHMDEVFVVVLRKGGTKNRKINRRKQKSRGFVRVAYDDGLGVPSHPERTRNFGRNRCQNLASQMLDLSPGGNEQGEFGARTMDRGLWLRKI